jgi:UMF1 family MFS transporter
VKLRRQVIAWALYDWGNSAFATAVIAGFFPIFFKQYWSTGIEPTVSSFRLGIANSAGSLVVLALAPALGAVADQGAFKKRFLTAFAAAGIVATAAFYLVAQGHWALASLLYVVAGIGFSGANVFYDALLVDVAETREFDFVSGLGYAAGYLGGGLFFGGCVALTLWPEALGLTDRVHAVRLSFVLTALWWGLFTLPLLRVVRERAASRATDFGRAVADGFRQLAATFRKIRRYRVIVVFLLAYWLYIDGVDTIVRMAVDYGMALGFPAEGLITALLITQFVGFPAALLFGWLGGKIGSKTGIIIGLAVYMAITVWGYLLHHAWEFYALAVAIGLVQGGVQSLSRSLYARLIPAAAAAEFFGFYNLLGKFAAVLGPALMGWVAVATGSNRVSILSLLLLFGLGALLLLFVAERRAERAPAG